ncbi:MAG: RAMP superfamily CRISPR-associated protein [Clostridiales bacterium]|nr:RAMP superfamily CRISPR-associated protein [Clostridiales bacterium]
MAQEKPVKATFDYAARYEVTATYKSPLRTGGANGNVDEVLCDQNGMALVQGSSLTGAVRGWMEGQGGARKALAATLFGSQERGGQLAFTNGVFEDNAQVQIRPRLAIDGEKGTARDKAKFDVAHVNVGAVFSFCVFWMGMHGQQQPACDALEDAFAALHWGDIRLGGQKSNGFGRVELEVCRAEYDMRGPNDRKAWGREDKAGEAVSLA